MKFHDGSDFDAEVVRWNYKRTMDPEEKAFDAPYYRIVESVEALDSHTVKFRLKHLNISLLPVMAANRAVLLQKSPASFERWGKEAIRLHAVGTGPFKLAKWGAVPPGGARLAALHCGQDDDWERRLSPFPAGGAPSCKGV
jgi:ABC-type transport system substrate-binding protein